MKRICFVNGSMGRGGAERVISIVSKSLVSAEYQTDICLLLFDKVEYELDISTRIFNMTNNNDSIIIKSLSWIGSIRSYIKKEKPMIIIAMSTKEYLLVKIASIGLDVKIVVSERNDPRCDGRGRFTDLLTTIFYPKAAKIIFQTQRAKEYFNEDIQKNGVIIPNPVSVECEATYQDTKKIVTVGRLEPQKNQELLIKAFSSIKKRYPDYKLYIYGKGSLLEQLKYIASERGVADSVFFPGESPNVHEMIRDAEMFVLSSDYEGLSNALLEALSMGIPCITTNCAGSEECITSGKSGIVVPVGDELKLEKAMASFISDKKYRLACGKQGKKDAERFNVSNVISLWRETFDKIIEV